jgi:hypothetical protein
MPGGRRVIPITMMTIKPRTGDRDSTTAVFNGFDQFVARDELQDTLDLLRSISNCSDADRLKRFLLECPQRGEGRMTLASFAAAQTSEIFVATVAGRGFNGKRRTVLLIDLRRFGISFVLESHLWVPYDKRWARIEPFYQGQKMVLVGTVIEYTRKNHTCDYGLALEKVTKLWPSLT